LSETSVNTAHPHHRLSVDARFGPLDLHARLELTAPWTVIFGPSGSGKTSLLRAACGLLPSNKSRPSFSSSSCFSFCHSRRESAVEPATSANASQWTTLDNTAPHLRSIGYAPQGAVLFPHLSVRENVAFAATARHQTANTQLIAEAIDLFELSALANRMPRDLSGGERQRVNLARAFAVPSVRLMLLDEPFTGVDRALRDTLLPRMRQRIAQLGIPVLSVTHDVEEALLLNAEVIRLDAGRIVAQGPAAEVLAAERISMLNVLQS
jgi:molybdate transport system ATP-binding protein